MSYLVYETMVRNTTRPTELVPLTATDLDVFTITGGQVEVVALTAEITIAMTDSTGVLNAKFIFNPTGTGASTDLCGVLDIEEDVIGTVYSITGIVANALAEGLWLVKGMVNPMILGPGTIDFNTSADETSRTGSLKYNVSWRPIDVGAKVTVS